MNPSPSDIGRSLPWEESAVDDAGAEASRIGGFAGDDHADSSELPNGDR
jgi:hypothetical protein